MIVYRVALLLATLSLPSGAATFYVANTGDNTTGSSWETAYSSISAAVAASASGDSIWIKKGTYFEQIDAESKHFIGGFAGTESGQELHLRDWVRNETIVSGEQIRLGETFTLRGDSTINGLTITRNADREGLLLIPFHSNAVVENCTIRRVSSGIWGAGILVGLPGMHDGTASAIIRNCTIQDCYCYSQGFGGGLTIINSEVLIEESRFLGNGASGGGPEGHGGGILSHNSQLTVLGTKFSGNIAVEGNNGGFAEGRVCYPGEGGAIFVNGGKAILVDCLVSDNQRTILGPGLFANFAEVECHGTSFLSNSCTVPTHWWKCGNPKGAAIYNRHSSLRLLGCDISNNTCTHAAAVFMEGGNTLFQSCQIAGNSCDELATLVTSTTYARATFNHCTFANNINEDDGDTFSIEEGSTVSFTNSIVRHASAEVSGIGGNGTVLASYSNIQGGVVGEGNIDVDPLFVDSTNGDYRLRMGSPCIDSASTSGPSEDLNGNPRPVDIIGIGTDGPGAFDMGAYEFQIPRSDLNSDGYVNEMDLMIFQGDWMKVSGP